MTVEEVLSELRRVKVNAQTQGIRAPIVVRYCNQHYSGYVHRDNQSDDTESPGQSEEQQEPAMELTAEADEPIPEIAREESGL
ncbi:hypothetical protein PI125_g19534 [Phytophthora idaei]|nr:hypothetical protein PI125_g19534 [Phytophthora idaei]